MSCPSYRRPPYQRPERPSMSRFSMPRLSISWLSMSRPSMSWLSMPCISMSQFSSAFAAAVLVLAVTCPPASAQLPARCPFPVPATPEEVSLQALVQPQLERIHANVTGKGQVIAVIDTGIAEHPRLPQVREHHSFLPAEDDDTRDCDSHGTIVAGILGAQPSEADDIVGIAPDAELIDIRQSTKYPADPHQRFGSSQSLAESIRFAADRGASIISMSVVTCINPTEPEYAPAVAELHDAVTYAEQLGVVQVAAAGNLSSECGPGDLPYPAAFEEVIAVRALADPHEVASYNLPVEEMAAKSFTAPGHVIAGVSPLGGFTGSIGDGAIQGTSFAAPWVSGMAALVRERRPWASPAEIRELFATAAQGPHRALDVASLLPFDAATVPARTDTAALEPPQHTQGEVLAGRPILMALAGAALLFVVEQRRLTGRARRARGKAQGRE